MKTLRTAALVVGAVAAVAATAGAGIALIGGASLASIGSTAALGLSVSAFGTIGALAAGVGAVAGALQKKPKTSASDQGQQSRLTIASEAPIPIVFGRTGVGGTLVHRMTWDHEGTKNRFLTYWSVLSGAGPIDGIEKVLIDGDEVTFAGGGDNDVAQGFYNQFMWWRSQLGACPESTALKATGFYNYPAGWGANAKLSGMAADSWTMLYDPGEGHHFTTGVPKKVVVLRGVKAWDPRQDSTYPGGSGSQRLSNPATWAYSANPAICGLQWCLGYFQNGKKALGVGAPADGIDLPAYVAAANVADANGWVIGGQVLSSDEPWQVLKAVLQAGGAEPSRLGALISCSINAPKVSLATLSSADVRGSVRVAATQGRRDRFNSVIPRYRSEAHDFEIVSAAKIAISTYLAEDGAARTREIELPLVPDKDQAAELATYEACNSREFGPITIPAGLRWFGYKPGDCITLNVPEANLVNQTAVITNRALDPASGVVTLTLRSETAAKHDFSLGKTTTAPPTPALQAVDPTAGPDWGVATDWPNVIDSDPTNHPKPEDGATNSRNPNSPLGATKTVGQVLAIITQLQTDVANGINPDLTQLQNDVANALSGLSAITTTVSSLSSTVGVNQSYVTTQVGALTSADQALSGRIDTVVSNFNGNVSSVNSTLVSLSNADSALSARIDQISASSGVSASYVSAQISNERAVRVSAEQAIANNVTNVTTRMSNAETSINSYGATLTNHTQSIATLNTTLSSTIGALSSPNLLTNPSFTSGGFSGWTRHNNGAWEIVANYNPTFAQQNTTYDNGYLFQDVSNIEGGKTYSMSFECENSNNAKAYMAVQWYNSSGSYTQQNGPAYVYGGWGNRLNGGSFTAPSGTTFARVVLYTYDTYDKVRVARLQFQRSDSPTAYNDGASIAALQAQVNTLSGTIADVTNNKLGAYFQVQAIAGGDIAQLTVFADAGGGSHHSGVAIVGNVYLSGDLFITGSIHTNALADNSIGPSWIATNANNVFGQGLSSGGSHYDPETGFEVETPSGAIEVASISFNLAAPGDLKIMLTCGMPMPSGQRAWAFRIDLDGSPIRSRSGTAFNDTPTIRCLRKAVPAGNHTLTAYFAGQNSGVSVYDTELTNEASYK